MRNAVFHRRMQGLALAAMLLLSLLPTLGRLAGPSTPPGASSVAAGGVWAQICTIAGLKLVKLAPGKLVPGELVPGAPDPLNADPRDPARSPSPHGDGMPPGQDCAYCPLLASLAVLLLCAALALAPPAHRAHGRPRPIAPWKFRHPSGLGSRGPPLPL